MPSSKSKRLLLPPIDFEPKISKGKWIENDSEIQSSDETPLSKDEVVISKSTT